MLELWYTADIGHYALDREDFYDVPPVSDRLNAYYATAKRSVIGEILVYLKSITIYE
jgi:hypothetical protein